MNAEPNTEMSREDKMRANAAKAREAKARMNAQNRAEATDDTEAEAVETPAADVEEIEETTPAAPAAVQQTAPAPKAPVETGPLMIEVRLLKKYAPFKIINVEGKLVEQGEVKQTVGPGIVELEADEATRVLERKQAEPTANTFASLRGR